MLEEIIATKDKRAAQKLLHDALTTEIESQGQRHIGYRPRGGMHPVWSNGERQLFYAYARPSDDQAVRRHWNAFGYFTASGSLRITAEINIPSEAEETGAQGFFARDPASGAILLMHSGLLGGGVRGLTHAAFYAWSGEEPKVVYRGGKARIGVIVAELGSENMLAEIAAFVARIADFKQDLASGLLDQRRFQQKRDNAASLMKEFVGRKSGQRSAEFFYETYHGLVVEAVAAARAPSLNPDEEIDKTVLIDLFVKRGERMTEVYEVKSKVDRTSLYGAIGQLVTHCGTDAKSIKRILVLPEGEIMEDINVALMRERILVRRYRLSGKGEATRVQLL